MQIEDKQSRMRFEFDDEQWTHLIKYDTQVDCKKLQTAVQGTKGVDILGIFQNEILLFIEATNYRDFPRPNLENLAHETAQKVRDTLAGIIGGARNSTHQLEEYKAYSLYLQSNRKSIQIVLWFEEDPILTPKPILEKREKRAERNLENLLKKRLNWLTTKVYIINHKNNPYSDSLTVDFL